MLDVPPTPPPVVTRPDAARQRAIWLGLGIAFVAGLWFLTLDARHLLRTDEGRYAEIAREMLVTGDWVTVRYNGLKYFEKPPLQMWMTALDGFRRPGRTSCRRRQLRW